MINSENYWINDENKDWNRVEKHGNERLKRQMTKIMTKERLKRTARTTNQMARRIKTAIRRTNRRTADTWRLLM